jgi:hypothetical protein
MVAFTAVAAAENVLSSSDKISVNLRGHGSRRSQFKKTLLASVPSSL